MECKQKYYFREEVRVCKSDSPCSFHGGACQFCWFGSSFRPEILADCGFHSPDYRCKGCGRGANDKCKPDCPQEKEVEELLKKVESAARKKLKEETQPLPPEQ